MQTTERSAETIVNGLKIAYREMGSGPPVLLLHGWPASAHLWRNIAPRLARTRRVIAPDLPGFGASDKPLNVEYSFRFFESILSGLLKNLGVDRTGLAVHDLGGPVGLYWATQHPERVERLAILNTLVYPELSWAVQAFLLALRLPLVSDFLASPAGLTLALKVGMHQKQNITPELRAAFQAPFADRDARRALLKSGGDLKPKGFFLLSKRLQSIQAPVRIIYGEQDRILPDIADTVRRLQQDFPAAVVTALPHCGHFLQEDDPDAVAQLMAEFFSA